MSTVSKADSGEVTYIPDASFSQDVIYTGYFQFDMDSFSVRVDIVPSFILFTIPDTKVDQEYTIRFKFSDASASLVSGTSVWLHTMFGIYPTLYVGTSQISNDTDPAIVYSNGLDDDFSFTIHAEEGSTPVWVYTSLGYATGRCPNISAGQTVTLTLASYSISFSDISYELQVDSDTLLEESKKQTQVQNNIFESITEFFAGFFDGIINAFISLFVPDDDFFSDYFERLNGFFSEKLGFLYVPVELLVEIIEGISNASSSPPGIEFPGIEWDGQFIIEPQTFSFSSIFDEMPGLQDAIYLGTDVIMIGALLLLLQQKLKEVLEK